MESKTCLRCGGEMVHAGQEQVQLGKYGWLTGAWSNLFSGPLVVDIYCCTECRKLEFYSVESPADEAHIARGPCPHCGEFHELDDAKCPYCGKRLY